MTTTAVPEYGPVSSTVTTRWAVVPGEDRHGAFVIGTWLKAYYYDWVEAQGVRWGDYVRAHREVIEAALGSADVRVATLADAPDVFLGFAVGRPGVLHFVYVKDQFRGHGIARGLVEAVLGLPPGRRACFVDVVLTHRTARVVRAIRAKFPRMRYNPYLVMGARAPAEAEHG